MATFHWRCSLLNMQFKRRLDCKCSGHQTEPFGLLQKPHGPCLFLWLRKHEVGANKDFAECITRFSPPDHGFHFHLQVGIFQLRTLCNCLKSSCVAAGECAEQQVFWCPSALQTAKSGRRGEMDGVGSGPGLCDTSTPRGPPGDDPKPMCFFHGVVTFPYPRSESYAVIKPSALSRCFFGFGGDTQWRPRPVALPHWRASRFSVEKEGLYHV